MNAITWQMNCNAMNWQNGLNIRVTYFKNQTVSAVYAYCMLVFMFQFDFSQEQKMAEKAGSAQIVVHGKLKEQAAQKEREWRELQELQ